jgi:hypothetical protein
MWKEISKGGGNEKMPQLPDRYREMPAYLLSKMWIFLSTRIKPHFTAKKTL